MFYSMLKDQHTYTTRIKTWNILNIHRLNTPFTVPLPQDSENWKLSKFMKSEYGMYLLTQL